MTAIDPVQVRRVIGRFGRGLLARGGEGVDEVLFRLSEQDMTNPAYRVPEPATKPVVKYLAETLADLGTMDEVMAAAFAEIAAGLHWDQSASYTDAVLGEGFTENYAWCQLIGEHGFFRGSDYHLGFLLLGPKRHYADHYHLAPELYWPLTPGSLWKKGDGAFMPRSQGEVIWHRPMVVHATKTEDKPLLAIYVWTKDTHLPARLGMPDQSMPGGATKL